MSGTLSAFVAICSVLSTDVIAERVLRVRVPAKSHRPSAVSTFEQTGKDLGRSILLHPASGGNLLLHLVKQIPGDNRFMRVLDSNPFFLRILNDLLVFVSMLYTFS